jgi:hypothetical protein
MNDLISTRTGIAAIVAGLGYFTGQAGELVFGSPSHTIDVVFVVLGGIGLIALGVALWGLRGLLAQPRRVRIGLRIALAGALLLGLFTVQAVLAVVRTGHVPETFALFGLGLLLVIIGQLLFASGLRPVIGAAWPLPILGALGAIVALTTDAYLTAGSWSLPSTHDIGLFVFEAAWVALGTTMLAQRGSMRPPTRRGPSAGHLSERPGPVVEDGDSEPSRNTVKDPWHTTPRTTDTRRHRGSIADDVRPTYVLGRGVERGPA